MNNTQSFNFTCKTCGGHELTVFHVWNILAGPESESWQEWGRLEANHQWHFKFKEKIENNKEEDKEEVFRRNFITYTKANSSPKPKNDDIFEPHYNSGNDKFYVKCASCDREIIFGWSKPNRGGGIFPVECSDFIPGEIWPEPRYLEFWHKHNWLNDEDGQT